jgi:hypothetical protein
MEMDSLPRNRGPTVRRLGGRDEDEISMES